MTNYKNIIIKFYKEQKFMTIQRQITQLGLALACAVFSISATAVPLTFTDTSVFSATDVTDAADGSSDLDVYGRGDVNFLSTSDAQALIGDYDYVAWTHHFEFAPAAGSILDGSVSLSIRDDYDVSYDAEFALGLAEDGTWGVGEVNTGNYDFNVSAAFLADGQFSLVVASLLGDFYIDQSALTITYEPLMDVAVPEPSGIAMLGFGLLLLSFMGHHLNSKPR